LPLEIKNVTFHETKKVTLGRTYGIISFSRYWLYIGAREILVVLRRKPALKRLVRVLTPARSCSRI
jgi:hypothetical protein